MSLLNLLSLESDQIETFINAVCHWCEANGCPNSQIGRRQEAAIRIAVSH
jgi:hypothetical protein